MKTKIASGWLALAAILVTAARCGTTTTKVGSQGTTAVDGQACTQPGATANADDGCNTCTCTNGHWSCTENSCSTNGGSQSSSGSSSGGTASATGTAASATGTSGPDTSVGSASTGGGSSN